MVRKVFHGLLPFEFPADIRFQITDPTGSMQEYALRSDGTILLENILPGTYTVTEVGYQVDGFDVRTIASTTIRVNVQDGTRPEIVIFDNIYTPAEPPQPPQQPQQPSPQTGLRSHTIYYAILIIGTILIISGITAHLKTRKE